VAIKPLSAEHSSTRGHASHRREQHAYLPRLDDARNEFSDWMWFSPPKRCCLFSLSKGALHPVYAAAASCGFSLQAECGQFRHKAAGTKAPLFIDATSAASSGKNHSLPAATECKQNTAEIPPWKIKAKSSRWGLLSIPINGCGDGIKTLPAEVRTAGYTALAEGINRFEELDKCSGPVIAS
jgi:hypothetical protein